MSSDADADSDLISEIRPHEIRLSDPVAAIGLWGHLYKIQDPEEEAFQNCTCERCEPGGSYRYRHYTPWKPWRNRSMLTNPSPNPKGLQRKKKESCGVHKATLQLSCKQRETGLNFSWPYQTAFTGAANYGESQYPQCGVDILHSGNQCRFWVLHTSNRVAASVVRGERHFQLGQGSCWTHQVHRLPWY